jgi:rRNA pseudouridine-1189 N-methylase Emg1 (Nep1/Mra1 family)
MKLYQAKTEPSTIVFHNANVDWVMRITADRRIEVNEDVEVAEAAQKVLDAMQQLLANGLDKAIADEREDTHPPQEQNCQEEHIRDLVYRLQKRAEIRRQISDRKSVQEGKPDRIADLLDEAADALLKKKNT